LSRYENRSGLQTLADWVMTQIAAVCVPIVLAIILAGIGAWRGWLWITGEGIGPRTDFPPRPPELPRRESFMQASSIQ
jgi:hypothetical protein